jgi:hypothetical protein
MTVAYNNDVDGIVVESDGHRTTPKITTIIFDVDDTLYDVATVSLLVAAVLLVVSRFFLRPLGRISTVVLCCLPIAITSPPREIFTGHLLMQQRAFSLHSIRWHRPPSEGIHRPPQHGRRHVLHDGKIALPVQGGGAGGPRRVLQEVSFHRQGT